MAAAAAAPVSTHALLLAIDSCSSTAELEQHHSRLIRLGLADNTAAVTRLLRFCSLHNNSSYSLRLLHSLSSPDAFAFNVLLGSLPNPVPLYIEMLHSGVSPNTFTFPSVFNRLSVNCDFFSGQQLHAHLFKLGLQNDRFTINALLHFYFVCGCHEHARRLFDRMLYRDVVSWTSMVSGYSELGMLDSAREVFDEIPEKNSVSWNAMISGCVREGQFTEAIELFEHMRLDGMELDNKFVAASMMAACSGLGALHQGQWIHTQIERRGIEIDAPLGAAIVDMYCKCGCLDKAKEVFDRLPHKGVSCWNCMIGGLAAHGHANAAIELFHEMEKENLEPDGITLLNLLTACSHAGLVHEGKYFFDYMVKTCNIEPEMGHYGCMVDILGRAGMLEEAKQVIDEMPIAADASVLGALLGACKINGNIEIGEVIGRQVIELDPTNSGRYVVLANLYAKAGRWEDVAEMRKLMNDRGVMKEPGCSLIEMDGVVSEFITGDSS